MEYNEITSHDKLRNKHKESDNWYSFYYKRIQIKKIRVTWTYKYKCKDRQNGYHSYTHILKCTKNRYHSYTNILIQRQNDL
jgi:hypothetical protein